MSDLPGLGGFISVFGKFSYVTFYADRSVRTSHNSAANFGTILGEFSVPSSNFFSKKATFSGVIGDVWRLGCESTYHFYTSQ